MESDNKLFLLDAYALIYRAYYAFIKNPRINSKCRLLRLSPWATGWEW